MLGGKSLANDTSHGGHSFVVDAVYCLNSDAYQLTLWLLEAVWEMRKGHLLFCDTYSQVMILKHIYYTHFESETT